MRNGNGTSSTNGKASFPWPNPYPIRESFVHHRNTQTTYKPWGTPEENGVGKMNDFTDAENCFYSFYYSGENVSLQANLNSAK